VELSKDSLTYRWAYWMTPDWRKPRRDVNLCPFFWRVVLLQPLKVAMLSSALTVGLFMAYHIAIAAYHTPWLLLFPPAFVALLFLLNVLETRVMKPGRHFSGCRCDDCSRPGLVGQYYLAVKKRYCPIIKITDDKN
jgi:hypothetical protein